MHDFALALAQQVKASLQLTLCAFLLMVCLAPPHRTPDGLNQDFIIQWFCQKLRGAGLHRSNRRGNVPVTCNKNDWRCELVVANTLLNIESAQIGKIDVKN